MKLHGGELIAKSDGVGQGAEFVITLPTAPPGAQIKKETASQTPKVVSGNLACTRRVLVVDNEQ